MTELNQNEVAGTLTGPFFTDVQRGSGALAASVDGLVWRLRSGMRNRSGLLEWSRITKWESGSQAPGVWVVFVTYDEGERSGFFGLHLTQPQGVIRLTVSVRPYLQETIFDVELRH
jgi:hypothetical protein